MSKALSHLRRCSLPDLPQLRKGKAKPSNCVDNFTSIEEHVHEAKDYRRHSLLDLVTLKKTSRKFLSPDELVPHVGPGRRTSSTCDLLLEHREGFWERNFHEAKDVPWVEFKQAFLLDYGSLLQDFDKERASWVISIMWRDIFEGRKIIYKMKYRNFIQCPDDPDAIWHKVIKYAKNKIFQEGIIESVMGR